MVTSQRGEIQARVIALAEVLAAFAVVHVGFRAFKRFSALGQLEYRNGLNISPGVAMAGVALALILLRRRRPSDYGLHANDAWRNINIALFTAAVYAIVAIGAIALGLRRDPTWRSASFGLTSTALTGVVLVIALWGLRRLESLIARVPAWIGGAVLLALAAAPVALAARHGSAVPMVVEVVEIILGAAVAEEVFFRGYMQPRLNEAFGRPWGAFGVPFGAGLIVTALMFGFIHALNSVDYFAGVWNFRWWHGLVTFVSALLHGLLRERTGSIVAPVVLHAAIDLAAQSHAAAAGP